MPTTVEPLGTSNESAMPESVPTVLTGTTDDFMEYPETPENFNEGKETESVQLKPHDFTDLSTAEKTTAAIEFLESKRFALFTPGEDTRIFDFIIETLNEAAREVKQ